MQESSFSYAPPIFGYAPPTLHPCWDRSILEQPDYQYPENYTDPGIRMASLLKPSVFVMATMVFSMLIISTDQKTLKPCLRFGCVCGKSRDPLTGKMPAITVKCERVFYNDIPNFENVSTRTERILFAKNKITVIKNNSFNGLKTKEIDFTKNKITMIQRNAFNGSEESLRKLILKSNRLTKVPTKALSSLSKLSYLDLSSNGKLNISDGAFGGLTALKTLILSNCNIKVVRYEMFKDVINLKVLKLDNNAIKDIGTVLRGLTKLEELGLGYNQLSRVTPSSIKRNKNIVMLNLEHNQLSSLPPVLFKGFKRLKILNLDLNPISKPFNLRSIAIISGSLEQLYVNECQLTKWPIYPLGILRKLKRLEIEHNDISKIPAGSMQNMSSLEILKLSSNPIQFTNGMFDGAAESLQELSLRNMQEPATLKKLPLKQLKDLKKLIFLDVSQNVIAEIDKDFFEGLPAIHYVFKENQIQNISSEAFAQFTTPIKLDLTDNLLPDLSFADETSKFSMINVSDNRITCDCHVFNLYQVDALELVGHCDNHRMGDLLLIIGSDRYFKIFTSLCQSNATKETSADDVGSDDGMTPAVTITTDNGTNSDIMATATVIQYDGESENVTLHDDDVEIVVSEDRDPVTVNASNYLFSNVPYSVTFILLLYYFVG